MELTTKTEASKYEAAQMETNCLAHDQYRAEWSHVTVSWLEMKTKFMHGFLLRSPWLMQPISYLYWKEAK